jgi:hypothetical protein
MFVFFLKDFFNVARLVLDFTQKIFFTMFFDQKMGWRKLKLFLNLLDRIPEMNA